MPVLVALGAVPAPNTRTQSSPAPSTLVVRSSCCRERLQSAGQMLDDSPTFAVLLVRPRLGQFPAATSNQMGVSIGGASRNSALTQQCGFRKVSP